MISMLFRRQIMLLVEMFVVNWGTVRRRLLTGKNMYLVVKRGEGAIAPSPAPHGYALIHENSRYWLISCSMQAYTRRCISSTLSQKGVSTILAQNELITKTDSVRHSARCVKTMCLKHYFLCHRWHWYTKVLWPGCLSRRWAFWLWTRAS